MLLQSDKDLPKKINSYGCYLMSIVFIVLDALCYPKKKCTCKDIIKIYKRCIAERAMDRDCFIKDPNRVVGVVQDVFSNKFFFFRDIKQNELEYKYADFKQHIRRLKLLVKNILHYDGKHSQQYISVYGQYILGKWKSGNLVHFVVMNGRSNSSASVWYDPLGNSNTVKNGTLHSTRVYSRIR